MKQNKGQGRGALRLYKQVRATGGPLREVYRTESRRFLRALPKITETVSVFNFVMTNPLLLFLCNLRTKQSRPWVASEN